MPIHFDDRDVVPAVAGLRSVLIVPCNMCPAVTVAVRENRPFLEPFRHGLQSAPFEEYLQRLQTRLSARGVYSEIFRSPAWHHWFMCLWTERKRHQLARRAAHHDGVIVLGCESALETVRAAVDPRHCRVIEGLAVAGIMNAELRVEWPGNVRFDRCRNVPLAADRKPTVT